jgi:PAS domain S-box-containing protein
MGSFPPQDAQASGVRLAALPVPSVLLEGQGDGRVLEVNPAFTRSFGFTLDQIPTLCGWLRSACLVEAQHQLTLDHWRRVVDRAFGEQGAVMRCSVIDAADERRDVALQVGVHGDQLLVVVIDNPEPRWAAMNREEARASQAEIALALTEAIPVGTYALVQPPDSAMGCFSFISERFLELTGLERARLQQDSFEAFACVHPADRDEWLRQNLEAFLSKRRFKGQCRLVVNGQTRWVFVETVPRDLPDGGVCWEGVVTDVTMRVQAQQSLQESERRLRRILENLPIPVATLSQTDGSGEEPFLNRRFLETFGYREEQLASVSDWYGLAYPDPAYRAEVEARWRRALEMADATGGLVPTGEYRVRCADGRDLDVLISGTRLENLLVVTLLDITERRQAERAMAEARRLERRLEAHRRLRLEQKLRSSLTAAAVAHEINQPLSIILLNARLAQCQSQSQCREHSEGLAVGVALDGAASDADALAALVSEAERMVTITEKMRSLLRNLQAELVPIDLAAVVESALLYLRPRLEEAGVALQRRGLQDPVWIRGDADQLQIALSNLVRNAIEALALRPDPRRILVALQAVGDRLELTIQDNGSGFPAGVIEALPLITTKPYGSGIGLYVVHTTAENHGASLHFGRSPLGGAAVSLAFDALPAGSVPESMGSPLPAP